MDTIECENMNGERVSVPRSDLAFRPTAYAIIVRDGAILAVRERGFPLLNFPGGGVECGERIADALQREVREETGFMVTIGDFLHVRENFFYCDPAREAWHAIIFYYTCASDPPDAEPVIGDVAEMRWMTVRELKESDFSSVHADIIRMLRDRYNA